MKRIILFKGKRVDNGEWVEGLPIYLTEYAKDFNEIDGIQCNKTRDNFDIHPETVCQFTGKLDVSKKMIFENDIVYHGENPLNKVVVVWNKRTCGFVLNKPNYQNEFTRISGLGKLKIIGNIYD